MKTVTIYTTPICGYCAMAKRLLAGKGIPFTEIDVMGDAKARAEMVARAGRTSVPQIFVGETHVGGCDDLHALEAKGGLDPLVNAA